MQRLLARPRLWTLVLFAVLSVAHTWPLATDPAHLSRNDNSDTVFCEWIVSWVAHQAPRDPVHLFDANIFYPNAGTLAYAEHMFVPSMMGAPVYWISRSPVLTYNVLVLLGLTLTGWAFCLLVWRWTGDLAAGVIAGVLIAFNAHTLTRLPQLQAFHFEFLPLALLAFDRILSPARPSGGRVRDAMLLAVGFGLQGLSSYYSMIFTTTALLVSALARPEDWWGARARRVLTPLAIAAALSLIVVVPFLLPYRRIGQVRSLDEVAFYAASWRDYFASPARVHFDLWSKPFWGGASALFPGVTSLALAAVALAGGVFVKEPKDRRSRARMVLAFGVAGVALSFGPSMPGYTLLYRLLPPLQGIRTVVRFGYLGLIACAMLAGYGVALIRAHWPRAQWMPAVVGLLFVGANLDAFSAPLELVKAAAVSPIHDRLRDTGAIVAEFPFYPPDRAFHNVDYMVDSTRHWRPMLNGYSSIMPESYVRNARDLAHFPDAASMTALRAAGVTHVFVHDRALRDWTDNETADAVPRSADLMLIAREGDVALYAVSPKP